MVNRSLGLCVLIASLNVQHLRSQSSEPVERLYDVTVVGAGTSGFAAAMQAARMGASVALVEETDWVGGQMSAAGVPTLDEGPVSGPCPTGIYRELRNRLDQHYRNFAKSTATCYGTMTAHCYEPRVVERIMRQMITDQANITLLDLTSVRQVQARGNQLEGLVVAGDRGTYLLRSRNIIDATETGDVIMKSPAQYVIGNGKPGAFIDDITFTAMIRNYTYPSLLISRDPPHYDLFKPEFMRTMVRSPGNTSGYPIGLLRHNQYRGLPNSDETGSYTSLEIEKISQTMLNWLNDYPAYAVYRPVPAIKNKLPGRFLTDPAHRADLTCEAKLKTINLIRYIQDPAGMNHPNWSVVPGIPSIYSERNLCPNIPDEFKPFERALSVIPYIRESARIIPLRPWTVADARRIPGSDGVYRARPIPDPVGVGDYAFDRHNAIDDEDMEQHIGERRSDLYGYPGPYQIPMSAMIPLQVDGLIAAEKNFGSRITSAAARAHPATFSSGQAAGVMAVISARRRVPVRNISVLEVQRELVSSGAAISLYTHADVPFGSQYWPYVQMSAALQYMVGQTFTDFGVDRPLSRREASVAIANAFSLVLPSVASSSFTDIRSDDWALRHIEAIYKAGFTQGCATVPLKFCGEEYLTREQLATFIARGINALSASMSWIDVPNHSVFRPYIGIAYSNGFMEQCGTNSFCPTAAVTRGDTARALVMMNYYRNGLQTP
jgi:hypothetical protein